MDMTPGRAIYNPDEALKPLRTPKIIRPETTQMGGSSLSATATEFVPRFGIVQGSNVQERLQRHQMQYLIDNYQQYQQPQQQLATANVQGNNVQYRLQRHMMGLVENNCEQYPQQQQEYNNQSYSNGYGGQQQQQLTNSMNSISISTSVQDRLRRSNNSGGGSGGGSSNSSGNGGNSTYYQQNQMFNRNNKHHHNNHHRHHNHHHQPGYNNHHYQNQHHHNQQHQGQQQSYQAASGGAVGSSGTTSADDVQNIALDYLQTVIQCLNQNPGQFDSIATPFITIFDGMENNHYVLSIAMEDIFDESIKNPNFRYMGAKLYNLLHMLNPQKDSLFHTFLKCKLDFHKQEMEQSTQSNQQGKVRETALFLAELYMQLRGDDSRILLIAENIVFSLQELLKHVTYENVRCICLTLKLAGYDLSTDCPQEMKSIIAKLEEINLQNPGKHPLASNVISLQKNNWGRKVSDSDSLGDPEMSKPPEPPRASDDPVFYGPDGREISAEECEFLTNGTGGTGGGGSTDNEEDNDLDDLDPEMDEETERDYKLFLRQTNSS